MLGFFEVPLRDQDFFLVWGSQRQLKLSEVEYVRQEVAVGEDKALISQLVEVRVAESLQSFDPQLWLVDEYLAHQVNGILVGV